eukprot:67965-Rhodomonas_salina.1
MVLRHMGYGASVGCYGTRGERGMLGWASALAKKERAAAGLVNSVPCSRLYGPSVWCYAMWGVELAYGAMPYGYGSSGATPAPYDALSGAENARDSVCVSVCGCLR